VLWATQFGTERHDIADGIAVDGGGDPWVVGVTTGTFSKEDRGWEARMRSSLA
jgi:hypothetical protein